MSRTTRLNPRVTTKDGDSRYAVLDPATGLLTYSLVPAEIGSALSSIEATPAPSIPASQPFSFPYSAVSANNAMVAGNISEVWRIPLLGGGVIDTGPLIQMDDYGSVDTVVDVEKQNSSTLAWSSIFGGGTKPTCPAGQTLALGANPPTAQAVAYGDLVRCKLISVPATGTTTATAATHPATSTTVGDASASNVNNVTVTLPTGGASGDTYLCILVTNGNVTLPTLPSGWSQVTSLVTTPAGRLTVWVFSAAYSGTVGTNFAFSAASPIVGFVDLIRSGDPSNVGQIVTGSGTEANTTTNAYTGVAATATRDADFLYLFSATYFAAAVDGYHQVWTNTPAGFSEIQDVLTGRGSAATDYGLSVGVASAVASGATIAAPTITLSGGSGSNSNSTGLYGLIAVKRAAGTHGPTRITAQLTVHS